MKNQTSNIEKIIFSGIMIALEIVLSKLISINLSFLRIGFGFLPIVILAILYGPIISGVAYAIGDVIGGFIFPTGPFFPGFTLTAFLSGIIWGAFLHNKKITLTKVLISSSFVCVICNLLLNTFWLTFIAGKGFFILLSSRIAKELIAVPIMAILILSIDKTVIKQLKKHTSN